MAKLDQIELPNGVTYDFDDKYARKLTNNDFDTINVTELNAGDLIVTGVGRFTNGLYGNLIGNASTATLATTASKLSNTSKIGDTNKPVYFTSSGVPSAVSYTLGTACEKGVDTTVTSGSSNLVTSGAVYTAIDNLPEPMVFKGTLGTGGTITSLPTAAAANEGFTYKVITAGTYASQTAKVGDVFVSNGSSWVLIPSGDIDSDTWRSIKVNGTEKLTSAISSGAVDFVNGTNTTVNFNTTGSKISINSVNTTYSLSASGESVVLSGSDNTSSTADLSSAFGAYLPLAGGQMTGTIITPKNDSMGIRPNTNNWGEVGDPSYYFYRSYIVHYYGTTSHIGNWDSNNNIGTAVSSSAAATRGYVNFYNECAAGGTQTKTTLYANANATANTNISLPTTSGTLIHDGEIPTVLGTKSFGVSTNDVNKKIKIKINPKNSWMLCFTVTLYQSYTATKVMISGYNYGSNHWYGQEARILSSTINTGINVYFGYDADYELWVGFDAGGYTGVTVDSVTNGFSQISNYRDMFTISLEDSLTTIQQTVVRYRPWLKNETVDNATNATNATSATTASKLGSSNVGSATQPIYLSAGTATACTYTLGKSVPSDAKFTDTTYTAGDNMTLSSNTFYATKRWNAVTQGQKWSRIILVANTVGVEGNSGLLHVACTRGNTVCNSTFLINASHASYGQITELGANNYSKFKVRLVVNSNGDYYVEIYDTASSIASGTTQTWHCSFLSFQPATITAYTTFTDGTTVPSGYTANGEMETVVGSSALAIRNITRSGVTFTATRQNGTTFTFTQQDNDHYAWSDITSKPTTISGYGITDAKIASGVITLGSNTITPLTASSTLDATKLSGTIPSGCYIDTKNTAGSTDTSSKIFLIGAASQAANPQTYSDDQVYVTSGTLQTNNTYATVSLCANTGNSSTTGGLSLYGGTNPDTYGIMFRGTASKGKHGYVQSDWATYFTMNNAPTRGWVFNSQANVASISGDGNAVFNGSLTVGGNTTNTSGVRQVYNSTTKSLDFVFVA